VSAPKPVSVEGFPGMPASAAWKPKVRMVEDIEELGFYPELHALGHRKPFCKVEVIREKIGTAQGIATEVSELATLRTVAPGALSCARINGRHKGVRIEPLDGAWLCYARDGMMRI
jgi:hypothetical protein